MVMTVKTPKDIRQELMRLADGEYRQFQSKLMPSIPIDRVLGVRVPKLRHYAKALTSEEKTAFLADLPHRYYDEDYLHGILLSGMRDFGSLILQIEIFLPHIDNWATCDTLRPKIFQKMTEALSPYIDAWLTSDHLYTVRFAIGLLLSYYLDEGFSPDHLLTVSRLTWQEYYVQMMIAWYFATALALHWEDALPYLAEHRLSPAVHKMTVRKACESFRITEEQKAILKAI